MDIDNEMLDGAMYVHLANGTRWEIRGSREDYGDKVWVRVFHGGDPRYPTLIDKDAIVALEYPSDDSVEPADPHPKGVQPKR